MKRNIIPTVAAVLLVLCTALAGGAVAQTDTVTDTPTATTTDDGSSGVELPANETFAVSNDTEELRVIVENTDGALDVTVYDASGDTRTEVATGTVDAAGANATDSYSFAAVDAAAVSEYELEVTGAGAENVVFEEVGVISGGGGFMDSGYSMTAIVVGLAAIGGLGLYTRSERR